MKSHPVKSILFSLLGLLMLLACQNSETKGQDKRANENQQDAKVVLTEYSDFECPACAYFYPIVKKLKTHYGEKLQIEYRYFPLNSHQYSMLAARAAEAARKQGKYLAMHDLLFGNQKQWADSGNPQPIFIQYAQKIGLDMKQFKSDLNAADTQKTVMEDKKKGINQGVNSTPTFYINDEEVVNQPRTYKAFQALIDIYMKEANQGAKSS